MEVLTHTKRRDFKTCHRYFYHRHEQHLRLRSDKPGRRRGAVFGSLIFAIQQSVLRGDITAEQVNGWADPEVAGLLGGLISTTASEAYASTYPDSTEEADALELEQLKVEVMALEYVLRYGFDHRREIVFDLPLYNPRTSMPSRSFRRGGKIDGCVITGDKEVRIIEDKFVGQIQKVMIDRLPLDDQALEYVDAFAAKGWKATIAYRHTRYPGINPTSERVLKTKIVPAESLDDFRQRLRTDVATRPDFYFDEQILFFPLDALEDYRRGRWGTAKQILRARQTERLEDWQVAWDKSPGRCWEYGGCEFIPLCTKREGAQDLYVVEVDNPELNDGGITDEYATS